MGIVVVEICDSNFLLSLNIEEIIESKYPEVAVLFNDCLGFCGLCRLKPYAMVNGKRIHGKTPEECLEKIKEAIEAELAFYA
ncbi:YuzB family protein [Aquibacillus koreensis]|uniref:YuzB family protein n=1 Tax=Aquibacillus koreensis TaxID=279446 RepID=A0A9X4AJ05_9BACI|nr:YuzB family protein [Aquibacillus koreensis]MCT2534395.1 YuzB family protein [Aquibacillus koreensis]MDC3421702.1 YuzB family protein [Aquibacillus koreensis]